MLINWQEIEETATDLKYVSEHLTVISAEPPPDLHFCGERVPLENFDVKERLDQELQRNVYYHSSTIMMIKRASRYRDEILRTLRENGVPDDFFYLALAESGLTNAVSPRGARGVWQFMQSAGKHYGLEISETVDERYHVEKATKAACGYLKDAFRKFNNWTLTAASYNMGEPRLLKAIARQNVSSYYDVHLNRETSKYVFRILAIKCIVENPARYGFSIRNTYQPVRYYTVDVSNTISDLAAFASKNGSNYRMIKIMNPWLTASRLANKSGKKYKVRFPTNPNMYAGEVADLRAKEREQYELTEKEKELKAEEEALEKEKEKKKNQALLEAEEKLDSVVVPK